jgi:hypothetical protein
MGQLDSASGWRTESSPAEYPVSPRVLSQVRGWKALSTDQDRHAVAYDVSPGGDVKITLFVLRAPAEGFKTRPTPRPFYTQNRSVAAWQSGDLLYVVVVEAPQQQYHQYIDTRTEPLA